MMQQEEQGRSFRKLWIAGVEKHYPGTPKPGYVSPWEDMPAWEQVSAASVFAQVRNFILSTPRPGEIAHLSREQGGRLVSTLWNLEVFRNYPEKPKPGYVAPYEQIPEWQREVDADIYAAIEKLVIDEHIIQRP